MTQRFYTCYISVSLKVGERDVKRRRCPENGMSREREDKGKICRETRISNDFKGKGCQKNPVFKTQKCQEEKLSRGNFQEEMSRKISIP